MGALPLRGAAFGLNTSTVLNMCSLRVLATLDAFPKLPDILLYRFRTLRRLLKTFVLAERVKNVSIFESDASSTFSADETFRAGFEPTLREIIENPYTSLHRLILTRQESRSNDLCLLCFPC
ncbi:hypothetical protein TWF718_005145 [Orbilia javanica]|uniref:Uncharacterized protein n=1 Tax=Orbilia javanica TaxID=47235 RepID=A0AAN8P0H4_9PEZI